METKRWKIKIKFEWDAWDFINMEAIRSKVRAYMPPQCKNLKVEVEEVSK